MKKSLWIVIGFFLVLSLPSSTFSQESVSATVLRIIDGDTMIMMVEGKKEWVNLLAVDAPETVQPWGMVALNALNRLVDGKDIRIELDKEQRGHEGQLWGYLWVGDIFVNREMVLNGYALWDLSPPNTRYDDEFLEAEFQARKDWKGMWKSQAPTADDMSFAD